MNEIALELTNNLLSRPLTQKKSLFCSMVLRLMDTEKYANNYCRAFALVCELFPEVDADKLSEELDKYI